MQETLEMQFGLKEISNWYFFFCLKLSNISKDDANYPPLISPKVKKMLRFFI